jgi:hypothetical protein
MPNTLCFAIFFKEYSFKITIPNTPVIIKPIFKSSIFSRQFRIKPYLRLEIFEQDIYMPCLAKALVFFFFFSFFTVIESE